MRFGLLILFICISGFALSQPPSDKSGTIKIEKDKDIKLKGLYKKTNVIYDSDLSGAKNRYEKDHSSGKIKSNLYFYFLGNGKLYQIESTESAKKVLELAKDDPVKLRPILASYTQDDSTLLITPLQEGLDDEMEPARAFFHGGIKNNRLFLTKLDMREVFIFEPVEE